MSVAAESHHEKTKPHLPSDDVGVSPETSDNDDAAHEQFQRASNDDDADTLAHTRQNQAASHSNCSSVNQPLTEGTEPSESNQLLPAACSSGTDLAAADSAATPPRRTNVPPPGDSTSGEGASDERAAPLSTVAISPARQADIIRELQQENALLTESVDTKQARIELLENELRALKADVYRLQERNLQCPTCRSSFAEPSSVPSQLLGPPSDRQQLGDGSSRNNNNRSAVLSSEDGDGLAVSAATSFSHASLQNLHQQHQHARAAQQHPPQQQSLQHRRRYEPIQPVVLRPAPMGGGHDGEGNQSGDLVDADDLVAVSGRVTPHSGSVTPGGSMHHLGQPQRPLRGQALTPNNHHYHKSGNSSSATSYTATMDDDASLASQMNQGKQSVTPRGPNDCRPSNVSYGHGALNPTPRRQVETMLAQYQRQVEQMKQMLPILSIPNFTYSIVQGGRNGKQDATVASYEVMVNYGEDAYAIYRRYSEFKKMHDSVVLECKGEAIPAFPGRKGFFGSTNNDRKAIEKRRVELQVYLRQLVASDVVRKSRAVKEFFANLSLETPGNASARAA